MLKSNYLQDRNIGRRKWDHFINNQVHRLNMIAQVGQIITSVINMDKLFDVIIAQTNQIMGTERSTLFLHDEKNERLWSFAATGMKKNTISILTTQGVAGWVFQQQESLIINDPYNDSRFYSETDKETGFLTKNILCIPVIDRRGCCIGVFQTLNKKTGDFDDNDRELLESLSHYVAIALENSNLYEELKSLDRAKERVINHLSHELKTPLTIINSVLGRFSKKLEEAGIEGMEKAVTRGQRNLNRLLDLQVKIDDIINQRSVEGKGAILSIIESTVSIVEELGDENNDKSEFVKRVSNYLENLLSYEETCIERISLDKCLNSVCDSAISPMNGRSLNIIRNIKEGLILNMDRKILQKVFSGLLKNAIENTPDGGKIEITVNSSDDGIRVYFRDYGVGITEQNKKNIFGGFFHTLDTNLYSSKNPYEFNAGGSGADLLRIKVFSERYGFSVKLDSNCCKFIPTDAEICPGSISDCQFITDESECLSSGGSTFFIHFPLEHKTA